MSNSIVGTGQNTESQGGNNRSGEETSSSAPDNSTIENSEENSILQDGVIRMDSDNYYNCLCELNDNLDQYIGLPIEVEGFVFKDNDDFTDNEFVPARLMMVCCAADMQLIGLLSI